MRFLFTLLAFSIIAFSNRSIGQCDFTISTLNQPFSCLVAEEEVVFTNVSAGMNVTGNDLEKT